MESLIQFRDNSKYYKLHPLMTACRILSAFHHIHPFINGNGRVGRLVMALYLIRNGYPPVIFNHINHEDYESTLFLAQVEMNPVPLYSLVVVNILNNLMKYQKINS